MLDHKTVTSTRFTKTRNINIPNEPCKDDFWICVFPNKAVLEQARDLCIRGEMKLRGNKIYQHRIQYMQMEEDKFWDQNQNLIRFEKFSGFDKQFSTYIKAAYDDRKPAKVFKIEKSANSELDQSSSEKHTESKERCDS